MKKLTIKVADASGSRRNEEVLTIERKNPPPPGTIVTVVFDDEYARNDCRPYDRADYTVERCEFETPYKAERGIRKVWLKKNLNTARCPGAGSCAPSSGRVAPVIAPSIFRDGQNPEKEA